MAIEVKVLSIEEGLITYKDVEIVKIKSKKYQLTIMKDYLPIIGEIEGSVEIITMKEVTKIENIVAYYMLKHNQFKLFIKEEKVEK